MSLIIVAGTFNIVSFLILWAALRTKPRQSLDDLLDETERHHKRIRQIQENYHA